MQGRTKKLYITVIASFSAFGMTGFEKVIYFDFELTISNSKTDILSTSQIITAFN